MGDNKIFTSGPQENILYSIQVHAMVRLVDGWMVDLVSSM